MDSRSQMGAVDPRAVLAQAYDAYGQDLYRYALMILADHSAAQDAVQQAFMKIMKMGKRILNITSSDRYLKTAVRNECYRIIKKQKRSDLLVQGLSAKPILENTDQNVPNEEERTQIETAIRKLPADQREVLHMKIYEDRTFQEIADRTGVSVNTVASRYRYAMEKLKERLTPNKKMEITHHG